MSRVSVFLLLLFPASAEQGWAQSIGSGDIIVRNERDCHWCGGEHQHLASGDEALVAEAEQAVLLRISGRGPAIRRGKTLRAVEQPLYVIADKPVSVPTIPGASVRFQVVKDLSALTDL